LTRLPPLASCGSNLYAAHNRRQGKPLDISEVKTIVEMLIDCDPRFKPGLSVFLEGAQGLSGNHRLLINAEDALEHYSSFERILKCLDKRWRFCVRSERLYILVFSPFTTHID
jgi:hypothetical protein